MATKREHGRRPRLGLVRYSLLGLATLAAPSLTSLAYAAPASTVSVQSSPANSESSQTQKAGEVVLSAGPAILRTAAGDQPVARGAALAPGDTVVTGEGGFVHVRMADGGLVAIRPLSLFQLEVFDYKRASQTDRVRYRLEEGVVRSITGEVGEVNKEAFRLNTPVAAVGVRGTDFVVATNATASRVAINSGAVVVAPLSDSCSATSFGSCSVNGVMLGKATSAYGDYVEVVRGEATPRMVRDPSTMPDTIAPPHRHEPAQDYVQQAKDVSATIASTELNERMPPLTAEMRPVTPPPPPVVELLPDVPLDVHWGRWTRPDNVEDTTLTRVSHLIRENKPILVVNSYYGAGVQSMATHLPRSGRVDFVAAGGEGVFANDSGLVPLDVAGGALSVNFDNRSFRSEASFASATDTYLTNAAGNIDARGYLHSDPARSNSHLTGALGKNLDSAVTTIERQFDNGTLSGVVAWGLQQ